MLNEHFNDPSNFWKLTKSVSGQKTSTNLPDNLKLNENIIKDKEIIVNTFNSHFISVGLTHNYNNLSCFMLYYSAFHFYSHFSYTSFIKFGL